MIYSVVGYSKRLISSPSFLTAVESVVDPGILGPEQRF